MRELKHLGFERMGLPLFRKSVRRSDGDDRKENGEFVD